MAIILGNRDVYDLPENQNLALGITLPIGRGPTGYFNQSFLTSDAVKTNIKNLLLTKQGERLMQPNFGTRLWNLLFENDTDNDESLENKIESEIESSISNWLPFVKIKEILINPDKKSNQELYSYNISITFTTDNLPRLESVTFNIQP